MARKPPPRSDKKKPPQAPEEVVEETAPEEEVPEEIPEAEIPEEPVEVLEEPEPEEVLEEPPRPPEGWKPGLEFKNIVRSRHTRLHRMVTPGRHRFKQYVGGSRILRGQKVFLTVDQILPLGEDLLYRVECGILAVLIPDGPDRGRVLTSDEFYEILSEMSAEPIEPSEALTAMPGCDPGPQATTKRRKRDKKAEEEARAAESEAEEE